MGGNDKYQVRNNNHNNNIIISKVLLIIRKIALNVLVILVMVTFPIAPLTTTHSRAWGFGMPEL